MTSTRAIATALSVLLVAAKGIAADVKAPPRLHWYRCNTHTHTSAPPHSDANGAPLFVAQWYRDHGYQCLVITDHEFLTDVNPLNHAYAEDSKFLVIQGQEITQALRDPSHPDGMRQAHVNGINIGKSIMPIGYPNVPAGISLFQSYQRNIAAIYKAGGVAQVNHPNLQWSIRLGDLLPVTQPYLFEIWNAFPTSNNLGGTDDEGHESPSAEAIWDELLSHGKVAWGVGSDDAHQYSKFDDRETPTPGKAWIVVQAPALTLPDVMDALRRGHFYASTGISLGNYTVDRDGISIEIAQSTDWNPSLKRLTRFTTRFIGANGRVLAEVKGLSPRYRFGGHEQYVRAAIIDSDGRRAWTQPVFFDERKDATQ
jgi:hypothetical protein